VPSGPFEILHNYRFNPVRREKPKRKVSACERYHPIPEFTMRTRKMTAEIELKQELSSERSLNNE
jgi:hypothetical protein